MQARDVFLTQVIQGPKQFVIPIFQRTYSWTHVNCNQLINDIMRVGESNILQSHFVGSLVLIPSVNTMASIPQWQVIDGQQRLTTVTLLISALLNSCKKLNHHILSATPIEGIREYFLKNTYGEGELKYKLMLTKGDKDSLCDLVDEKNIADSASNNITKNHQYFLDIFQDIEIIEKVYKGIQKLKVVEVILEAGNDDPQAIFESLNSTGVDLSQADLIRNYVLMKQSHEQQKMLYENIWFPMEELFGNSYSVKFDRFAQDFLTLKTRSNTLIKSRDIYPTFKEWFNTRNSEDTIENLISEISQFASYYCYFALLKETDSELKESFFELRALVEVASPIVMRLYHLYDDDKLDKNQFLVALKLISSYVLRRSVCELQTRSLGNIFSALAHKIYEEQPLESLKVALARFSKNNRFPNDVEFKEALINRDLYDSRICRIVLEKLENDSKEKIDTSKFTIEHIIPQNPDLRSEWQQMLGENWKEVQEIWLHRLGNLTLTGYNSEYQDKPFQEKKTIVGGFNDSPLRLNRDMRDAEQWTEVELIKRAERLADKALKLYPVLAVYEEIIAIYVLAEKQKQTEHIRIDNVGGISDFTKSLFEILQKSVMSFGQDITLIINKKNLTFFTLEAFLQAIPRKQYLALILTLDFDTLEPELQEISQSTSNWAFITNGDLKGIYCEIHSEDDVQKIMPLISQSYEEALA